MDLIHEPNGPPQAQNTKLIGMEARGSKRFEVHCPVLFRGETFIGEGTLLNLSAGGHRVETDETLKPGTRLALRIFLPDQAQPLTIDSTAVRWSQNREFGAESLHMPPSHRQRLHLFLDGLEQALQS